MKLNYNVSLNDITTKERCTLQRGEIQKFLKRKNLVSELEWKKSYSSVMSARTSLKHVINRMGITNIRIIVRGQRVFLVKEEAAC